MRGFVDLHSHWVADIDDGCRTPADGLELLRKLKRRTGDSFTKVIRRHIIAPAETAGELLDAMVAQPPPNVDLQILERIERGRGRRSGGRK